MPNCAGVGRFIEKEETDLPQELSRNHVVGVKQTRRALAGGHVTTVYLARDADPTLIGPVAAQAEAQDIPVNREMTMAQLGQACGIAVKAACAATLILTE